ncbi:MAG TPA: type II toxin-antitoxin system PemK/MazF family toxin [Bryobacteraceae bacterium]|nr:type II toxin-antitoxin system PemK/MazF family toxin [Bryobacteraceae bacterium]
MTLLRGDVVLLRIDFHQSSGGKVRPAVVLLDTGDDDFVAAPVTSKTRSSPFEVAIGSSDAKRDIVRTLGRLAEPDLRALSEALRRAFAY